MGRRKRGRKGVVNQALYNVRYPSRSLVTRSVPVIRRSTLVRVRSKESATRLTVLKRLAPRHLVHCHSHGRARNRTVSIK